MSKHCTGTGRHLDRSGPPCILRSVGTAPRGSRSEPAKAPLLGVVCYILFHVEHASTVGVFLLFIFLIEISFDTSDTSLQGAYTI